MKSSFNSYLFFLPEDSLDPESLTGALDDGQPLIEKPAFYGTPEESEEESCCEMATEIPIEIVPQHESPIAVAPLEPSFDPHHYHREIPLTLLPTERDIDDYPTPEPTMNTPATQEVLYVPTTKLPPYLHEDDEYQRRHDSVEGPDYPQERVTTKRPHLKQVTYPKHYDSSLPAYQYQTHEERDAPHSTTPVPLYEGAQPIPTNSLPMDNWKPYSSYQKPNLLPGSSILDGEDTSPNILPVSDTLVTPLSSVGDPLIDDFGLNESDPEQVNPYEEIPEPPVIHLPPQAVNPSLPIEDHIPPEYPEQMIYESRPLPSFPLQSANQLSEPHRHPEYPVSGLPEKRDLEASTVHPQPHYMPEYAPGFRHEEHRPDHHHALQGTDEEPHHHQIPLPLYGEPLTAAHHRNLHTPASEYEEPTANPHRHVPLEYEEPIATNPHHHHHPVIYEEPSATPVRNHYSSPSDEESTTIPPYATTPAHHHANFNDLQHPHHHVPEAGEVSYSAGEPGSQPHYHAEPVYEEKPALTAHRHHHTPEQIYEEPAAIPHHHYDPEEKPHHSHSTPLTNVQSYEEPISHQRHPGPDLDDEDEDYESNTKSPFILPVHEPSSSFPSSHHPIVPDEPHHPPTHPRPEEHVYTTEPPHRYHEPQYPYSSHHVPIEEIAPHSYVPVEPIPEHSFLHDPVLDHNHIHHTSPILIPVEPTADVVKPSDEVESDDCSCDDCYYEDITDHKSFCRNACRDLEQARNELKVIFDKIKKKLKCTTKR